MKRAGTHYFFIKPVRHWEAAAKNRFLDNENRQQQNVYAGKMFLLLSPTELLLPARLACRERMKEKQPKILLPEKILFRHARVAEEKFLSHVARRGERGEKISLDV